ncbi:MAG: hypothetical protein ACT4NY_09145 [Pseudonocardiales bacterium]
MVTESFASTPVESSDINPGPSPEDDLDPWPAYVGDAPPSGNEGPLPSDELCAWVREQTDTVLLGLSFGKDSLASFERLRRHWPVHAICGYSLYSIPGLEFQRRQVTYYREALGIRVLSFPHASAYRLIAHSVFQPPSHLPVIIAHAFPPVDYGMIYSVAADGARFDPDTTWVATGIRAADSPIRRVGIMSRGPYDLSRRVFFPVWDYRKPDVLAALDRLGVPLPVDYRLFGRTFDGCDYRFVKPLAEHFPEDYERLRRWMPLVDVEFLRRGERPPGNEPTW